MRYRDKEHQNSPVQTGGVLQERNRKGTSQERNGKGNSQERNRKGTSQERNGKRTLQERNRKGASEKNLKNGSHPGSRNAAATGEFSGTKKKPQQPAGQPVFSPVHETGQSPETSVRINKLLSDLGVCSRREADRMLEAGRITVNGQIITAGTRVSREDEICVDGRLIAREEQKVLLMLYKPRGIVCTAEPREKQNVIRFMKYPLRIYPVGRLDKDSEGLLLLTNEGDLVNRIMRAGNYHEKEYQVTVNRPVTPEFLQRMREGVPILDTVTRPCQVTKTGKNSFTIILTQGLNRQIRRMCEALDYQVVTLKRVRIMNIRLGSLPEGQYREVTKEERAELDRLLAGSSSLSYNQKKG